MISAEGRVLFDKRQTFYGDDPDRGAIFAALQAAGLPHWKHQAQPGEPAKQTSRPENLGISPRDQVSHRCPVACYAQPLTPDKHAP